ncbi:MAG: myristylated IMV envelope protein [Barrevirus sp.]|uniref:Myristylated IMV envelope protein n=1 Tax=Barrevirus sp. TaxID=2487763 RepID=A0A3G4ZTM0_9VIRU|nr:MAG: myristylated IMV envelope protein [Barrevirus sp.]
MGINVSKSISNVSSKIITQLEQSVGASATASCSVTTGNIILNNATRCTVDNENRCSANASAALDAISKAAANAWLEASNDQKTSLLPGINVNETTQNVAQIIKTKLNQTCQTGASLTQSIATGDLIINGCTDSAITNINAGTAEANCGIKTIMNAIVAADAKQQATQSTGDIFGSLFGNSTYISLASFLICICFIMLIIFLFFFNK